VYAPDSGEVLVDGEPVSLSTPGAAQERGIATVYQDLALAPELAAAQNLFLGREVLRKGVLGRLGFLDRATMRRVAIEQFAKLGIELPSPDVPVASLSGGQRQSIAIARAAMWASKVILMDEPAAALGVVQTARVLDLIKSVRDSGTAVVLISHNMPQVVEVADRVEVLRLGRRVAMIDRADATIERLVTAMTSGTAEAA
jgi:simple sugar transport system ATP-binding protein